MRSADLGSKHGVLVHQMVEQLHSRVKKLEEQARERENQLRVRIGSWTEYQVIKTTSRQHSRLDLPLSNNRFPLIFMYIYFWMTSISLVCNYSCLPTRCHSSSAQIFAGVFARLQPAYFQWSFDLCLVFSTPTIFPTTVSGINCLLFHFAWIDVSQCLFHLLCIFW